MKEFELMKPNGIPEDRKQYTPIDTDPNNWAVVQLSRNRKAFVQEVTAESVKRIKGLTINRNALIEELEITLYRERLRIEQNPWKVDPEDEAYFWRNIKSKLLDISSQPETHKDHPEGEILEEIINRYAEEIAGNFKPSSFKLARAFVTFGFSRLLNASRVKGFSSLWSNQYTLQDKIHITGHTDHIRSLAKKGTIVLVPTHFSNLDPILIGWVIHTLGLPPFIYGAGLNLFNIGLFAYFMNSLGAYKVDRRKKNMLYIETLKAYSSLAIQRGCHSIFFPGGTRSRDGGIEKKLKMGLLGTAMEAQRINFEKDPDGSDKKIFVVPVVLNYHFVLEAPALINEYLKQKGQERYYVEGDKYSTSYKIIKFLLKFFTKGSDISVSIGRGMDILGNYVDDEGESISKNGQTLDTREYFMKNGKITRDKQREEEYTRRLSNRIVEEFHKINRVFASHLAAFTAFEIYKRKNKKLDLYNLLRLPEEDQVIKYQEFRDCFENLRKEIFKLKKQGKIDIAPHLDGDLDEVITFGLSSVGMYHSKRPLIKNKAGDIETQDLNTLLYYHNRLEGYGLEEFI